jgi:Reverse transcriptase (RNA-dependent DNA polymerase)
MHLDVLKGPGPDGITPLILKKLVSVLSAPLTLVFNLSLASGVFPSIWKESYVVPLFKSGDKRDISCYRGISILSVIPKMFEKLICDVITPIIRPMISECQHGFVSGRSTVTSLVQFSNYVINEMEDGLQVDSVYTDFSKAFDRVNHGLLLVNLKKKFRPPMLCWMSSYLFGRTQCVKLDDYLSGTIYCHSGVPQGSHLGPLFFILDINDVLEIFEHVNVLAYADDLKLFMTVKCIEDCERFQHDLDLLHSWCLVNKFDLNADKCKSVSFGRGSKPVVFQYSIGGTDLERVNRIKDLGVIIDDRMTFVSHIEAVVAKSARMLGFVKRISKEFSDPYTYKTLYVSLVRPNLEYASCVWSPHHDIHSKRIERIQHNFVRFALRGLHWTHQPLSPYDARCLLLSLEILVDRRKVAAALFVRDILCDKIDSTYLASLLCFEDNPYSRRRHAKLMSFFHRTNYGKHEPLNNAIGHFNHYCNLFGFRAEESHDVFRNKFRSTLSVERSRQLQLQ